MALTKIGATLGGSADIITVTQTSHGFVSNDIGKAVKMTNSSGTPLYALATADSTANADAIGIIIAVPDGNTLTLALSGRITVDGCVPSGVAGTVLFLHTAATGGAAMGATDSGHLTSTEPSGNNEVSKPMAVITIANSEMIMVQQRGEVISTAGITLADGSVDNEAMADDAINTAEIVNDAVTADKLANSINTEIAANTAKVTNATHTGDVTGATTLTIAANAVTLAKMAGGTDGNLITYDTSGDPAYVATGTATHVLTSNGADTAPTFQAAASGALSSTIVVGSRTSGEGSGTEAITGAGFAPTAVIIFAVYTNSQQAGSWGFGDDAAGERVTFIQQDSTPSVRMSHNDGAIMWCRIQGSTMSASLTSLDSDGATFAFTKSGDGFTITYKILFLR